MFEITLLLNHLKTIVLSIGTIGVYSSIKYKLSIRIKSITVKFILDCDTIIGKRHLD